ncbi:MAG: hypothetical protein JO034_24500, partial [Singulisphaera sp.]|nr:hypothetical protein [Singulisphaera sp.]
RSALGNIGIIVLPDQVSIPSAFEAFAEDGALRDPKKQAAVEGLEKALSGFAAKLKASPRSRRMTGSRSIADVARSSLNTKRRSDGRGAESRANHQLGVARPDHPGQ